MSHLDDGTLHAYLDGELSALEAVRVEAHAKECAACQARLTDQHGLIVRATELLAAAMPPERPAPPLPRPARVRTTWWRARWPLAAAASVVLALVIGFGIGTREQFQPGGKEIAPVAAQPTPTASPSIPAETEAADEVSPPATPMPEPVQPTPTPPPAPERIAVAPTEEQVHREAEVAQQAARQAAPETPAPDARSLATTETRSAPPTTDALGAATPSAAVRAAPPPRAAPSPEPAAVPTGLTVRAGSELLGAELLGIPGLPVLSVRRASQPGYAAVILVEQALDSTTTVQIVHRRATPGAAKATPQPTEGRIQDSLGRPSGTGLGDLEIEVTGALSVDSLAALRAALRPLEH